MAAARVMATSITDNILHAISVSRQGAQRCSKKWWANSNTLVRATKKFFQSSPWVPLRADRGGRYCLVARYTLEDEMRAIFEKRWYMPFISQVPLQQVSEFELKPKYTAFPIECQRLG